MTEYKLFKDLELGDQFTHGGYHLIKVTKEDAVSYHDSRANFSFRGDVMVQPYDDTFEQSVLPDWATELNKLRELKVGAQLQTRDGRRRGNARITGIKKCRLSEGDLYEAVTEAGNNIAMCDSELHSMYYVGPYILKSPSEENMYKEFKKCQKGPCGWSCIRKAGHEGPCALVDTKYTTVYEVKSGDTLYDLSKKFYGDPELWRKIVDANPLIGDPNLIFPGQFLNIPQ